MVGQPAYFTSPDAFGPPQQSLAEQLAAQGFLSPGMQGPGEEMFYGLSPEAQGMMSGVPDRMYAGQSITPELLRYLTTNYMVSGHRDQLRQESPSWLHPYMPQLNPGQSTMRYHTSKDPDVPDRYEYQFKNPVAAPKFQELPSIDIQKRMEQETEAEGAEWDMERRGLLRTGAGRNIFGRGRT